LEEEEERKKERKKTLVCLEMFTLNILRKYESDCHWNCSGYRHTESFNLCSVCCYI